MTYGIEFKPQAVKDLRSLPKTTQRRILAKIEGLRNDLSGDVKRLTNFTPEYRLRVGQHHVLFEVEGTNAVICRILHRKDAYR